MPTQSTDEPLLNAAVRARPEHYALMLVMGILWGLALSLAKIGVLAGGHPVGMALWQVATSSTLLLALLLLQSKRPVWRADVARFGLICGACGVSFPAIALFWCALYLPAGVVAIAFSSMPLFTYLLGVAGAGTDALGFTGADRQHQHVARKFLCRGLPPARRGFRGTQLCAPGNRGAVVTIPMPGVTARPALVPWNSALRAREPRYCCYCHWRCCRIRLCLCSSPGAPRNTPLPGTDC